MSNHAVHYFAYGSNMCTARLRQRVPSARPVGRAELAGWRLSFTKRSVDESGKCTIERHAGESVYGAVFEIAAEEMAALSLAEGPGYRRVALAVDLGERQARAHTYVARRSWIVADLPPYDWYVDYVLAGAVEHELPARYVDGVLSVAFTPDPESERAAVNRALLRELSTVYRSRLSSSE